MDTEKKIPLNFPSIAETKHKDLAGHLEQLNVTRY